MLLMEIEITQNMNPRLLGLVTKGLCNMLLNSFGDSNDIEYPHIAFPLKDIDKLIVTTPQKCCKNHEKAFYGEN
jgi:hypothetical protein